MWTRADPTLDQDFGTASNSVSMYTVQCRGIVDNKCDFQQSSSHDDCTCDARLVSMTRKDQQAKVSEICQDDLRSQTQVEKGKTRSDLLTSHLAKCGPIVPLQVCQLILVQPIQCVRFHHTRVPTQVDDALQPSALAEESREMCVPSLSGFVASIFLSWTLTSNR